ncbi:unnamed protein product [Menidia menidia]|uniref:(Atlantic silverside) hypothetical protein n=1 Tax=Menidia menidia TaxID=238744 RepID=A0A8S4AKH7_9TELE|nr:unnamed protein product [Menidia menidia]
METEEREDASQKQAAGPKAEAEEDPASCHTCGVCGRSFPLLSSLSQHMRRHTREKPYKCPYCEHRTAQKGSLKAHIRSHKLGLFSLNLSDKEADDNPGQRSDADTQSSPGSATPSDKTHNANGKVKKGTKKKVKGKDVAEEEDEEPFTCTICGQVFPQVLLLKSHMKRHRGSQDHGCRICGRRFRQAWFLQSHMRIHRVKAQLRGGRANDPPATVNGVPQDPASLTNEECLYELCAGCGNFFYDRNTLQVHERLHRPGRGPPQSPPREEAEASDLHVEKKRFLESLNLTSVEPKDAPERNKSGQRILELDPVCSYQAWQLATRGRLAEATEKCLGWEERLADAEVAYDTEKGEYIPLREKKRKQIDTSNSSIKKKKGDAGLEHTSNTLAPAKVGDKKICQRDRVLLNGLGHAFYEALQTKQVKDAQLSSKQNKAAMSQEKEDRKSFFCEHCDFRTPDPSVLKSHLHAQHLGFYPKQSTVVDNISRSGSKASRYMDYLRSRSLLLSQPYWNPYTGPPAQELLEANIKKEKSNETDVKGEGHMSADGASLLNLSSLPVADGSGTAKYPVKTEGLVRHQCPYCSHTTTYPEVLWIHQRVAHKVDGGSSMAPKWAPCTHGIKSSKAGANQWRRTGPPPFLEGKDCPALPARRTQRTQPPGFTGQSSSKQTAPKTQLGVPKSKNNQPKDHRPSEGSTLGGRVGPQPQRKSGEHKRAAEGGSKSSASQGPATNSAPNKSLPSFQQPPGSPKHRRSRSAVEGNFPQEGLGFMLARNSCGTSSDAPSDRLHARRPSRDFPSSKGPDLWAAMNMWGLHGGKAYLDPLLFAQGKSESSGEMPMDVDILSLLKNYSPHDLAALYQHWGFVDPRLDRQATLQLNGHFGNEVHSSSEPSKQMNSRSSSSSGSLHKGT